MLKTLHDTIDNFADSAKAIYGAGVIDLHRPLFEGDERQYVLEAIDSTYVSSVGPHISDFEAVIAQYVGAKHAIATVNGTAALHVASLIKGIERGTEVITQAATFVATANAIAYTGAQPVFIDVDLDTLGMSPTALNEFLITWAERKPNGIYNRLTGAQIKACIPMHTFGRPCRIREISDICNDWGLSLIEDAAESLGSFTRKVHTGTFGDFGVFSFNGNKVITGGGGGMLITDDDSLAKKARHLTTTAKKPHPYNFDHDQIAFNYRMPNINAALALAQFEKLSAILAVKRRLASHWKAFFGETPITFLEEPEDTESNYWLNTVLLEDEAAKDLFLRDTNAKEIRTRPLWNLMSDLPMYHQCQNDGLPNSKWLKQRLANIPSSVPSGSLCAGDR